LGNFVSSSTLKYLVEKKKIVKHFTRNIILTGRIISGPLNVYLMTLGVTVWTQNIPPIIEQKEKQVYLFNIESSIPIYGFPSVLLKSTEGHTKTATDIN
jgi:hypothetical protein